MLKDRKIYLEEFFSLIRAGLWEKEVLLEPSKTIDLQKIFYVAEEQAVVGLVAAGLDHLQGIKVPQDIVLQIIGEALQYEQRNLAMNDFVAKLIERLREKDIYTILVKGQGVAQCYERPLWRACGDIDLLLNGKNYDESKKYLQPISSSVEDENKKRKHIGLIIDSWLVELHGTLHTRQLKRLNKVIDDVQYDVLYHGNVRSWKNGNTTVFLPSPDNDIFFVFAHIIQHYFGGGIGLRQICDWCRLLWTYRTSINIPLLEKRLREAGMMTEWKAFATLAVEFLGMPADVMPLYSTDKCWKRKANKVMDFVMMSGNLGKNNDGSYREKYPYLIWKLISLWRYVRNTMIHVTIFPRDSLFVLTRMMFTGF